MKNTRFKKGDMPWNKNLKGIHLFSNLEFKQSQYVGKSHPSWKGGRQKPKNDCKHLWLEANKRVRKPRKIYEDYYREIPKGYVIVHLDGDKYKDDIFNLEAISRAENLRRNNLKRNYE
jgi:hypothetical protein